MKKQAGQDNLLQQIAASWRFYLVALMMVAVAFTVAARVVFLQVIDSEFLQNQGEKRIERHALIPAYRGMIQDRNGEPLAVSTPVVSITANPQKLVDESVDWSQLASHLGTTGQKLHEHVLQNQHKRFMYLSRHMPPHKAQPVLALAIKGIDSITEYRRYYPAGEVAAHVVGFVDIDETGKEGLELTHNKLLQGHPGEKRVLKDRNGRVVKDIGLVKPAKAGRNLQLSIDLRAQYLAYKELLTAVTEYKATSGSVVAVDIRTGEVLAMANYPSYNPNNRLQSDFPNFRNRAVTDVFEPGSTVKPFSVAAALETGDWHADSRVNTAPGYLRIGRRRIRDSGNYGEISLSNVIAKSSNVGVSKVAMSLKPDAVANLFQRVGLGQPTGVMFPGENLGVMPYRDIWRPIDVASLSFGYGLSVTALQLVQAYSVIAADGLKTNLSLIKRDPASAQTDDKEQALSQAVAREIKAMLATVVSKDGTGQLAKVPGYQVAGKTGTVHKVSNKGYQDDHYTALFAGIAPVEDPQIAMVVVIDDPRGENYYGGKVAAPVFSRVMSGLLRMKKIPVDYAQQDWVQGGRLTASIGEN